MRRGHFFYLSQLLALCLSTHLIGVTNWVVTDPSDPTSGPAATNTLRGALLAAQSGDTISISVSSISLSNPLPTITQSSLTISSPGGTTIGGGALHPIFSIAPLAQSSGVVSINNLVLQNGLSIGGSGGNGAATGGAGGGGAGGGGAVYAHTGANVLLESVTFSNNTAQGGAGGNNIGNGSGGGGGGFHGGAGGDGTQLGVINNSGGGGGGGPGGGNGAIGGGAPANAQNGGIVNILQSAGGGGGAGLGSSSSFSNGGSAFAPQSASTSYPGGVTSSTSLFSGGGGAGPGGRGMDATASGGGIGGIGIGVPLGSDLPSFGGGGGGGLYNGISGSGGAGTGMGGGGGGGPGSGFSPVTTVGGAGGLAGGGGGGALFGTFGSISTGGQGGFGGGGGSGTTAGGSSLFGGGAGTTTLGGGGAGMGGAIFVQNGAVLNLGDATIFGINQAISGSGGNSGAALGQDLFIVSGGTVIFSPSSGTVVITNAIQSNQGVVGTNPPVTTGGIIKNGAGTLSLAGLTNTYTGTTTINQGIVQINNDLNLGSQSLLANVSIGSGTLQLTINSVTSARAFSLTAAATISTNGFTAHLSGPISGSGSLTISGGGTLNLTPSSANTYQGGTILRAGTLSISAISNTDSALGSGSLTMLPSTTFLTNASANMSSSRTILLQGSGAMTIQTEVGGGNTLILAGPILGSGSLVKTGSGNLWLTGVNSYSGGTEIQTNTLFGNTASLQGAIQIDPGTNLTFLQTASGAFQGTLSGSGSLNIGDGFASYPQVQINTNNSPGFGGTTTIFSGGSLSVNGSLASSPITINSGGYLSGTGTVGPTTSSGTIKPGNSIGTLTISGPLVLNPTSEVLIEISPGQGSLVQVLGTATLDGTLTVSPESGFYGFGATYTILSSTGLGATTFAVYNSTNPGFTPQLIYTPNSVILSFTNLPPFDNFPFGNPNEESVGENINALVTSGSLSPSSPLGMAISSLVGLFPDQINEALDQMHPAPFSAFAEIQTAFGAQLLSFFHRRPGSNCACENDSRIWFEPYGNWLLEKSLGFELGFHARSQGGAAGIDTELADGWTVGLGGAWNKTHMKWNREQGFSSIQGWYAAAYSDYSYKNFYLGAACVAGFDQCRSTRHLHFSDIDEQATAKRHNTEIMGQICLAWSSGPSNCFTFPYVNIDYFYLREGKAKETGAPGLNLQVESYSESTLRTEAGFLLEGQAQNEDKTFCLSPLFGVGWAMETPLNRPLYKATFEGQTIPFRVTGWDYTWQLFTVRLGLTLSYRCVSLFGGYWVEVSPLAHTPFVDQRGDIRLNISW